MHSPTVPNPKLCCLLGWVFEWWIVPAWQALCEAWLLLVSLSQGALTCQRQSGH